MIERGQAYGYVLLERIEREPDGDDEVELASGGLLLDLTCLHSADGAPLAPQGAAQNNVVPLRGAA